MTTTNDNASVEKLANSLVLGTSVARLVGSSPTRRTIRKFWLGGEPETIIVVSKNHKPCCTNCCISTNVALSRWKGVANLERTTQCVRLRKLCHSFHIFRCADNLVSTTIIIKNLISTQVQKSVQHMQHFLCNKLDVQIFQTK